MVRLGDFAVCVLWLMGSASFEGSQARCLATFGAIKMGDISKRLLISKYGGDFKHKLHFTIW